MSEAPPQNETLDQHSITAALARLGVIGAQELAHAEPLEGGVSSEIWRVEAAGRRFCLKRALPQLKVAQLWEAPTSRNHYEYAWFRVAGRICPEAVPGLIGEDPAHGLFVMEYLDPASYPLWKQQLRDGVADPATAAAVGIRLAQIHGATAGDGDIARLFATDVGFYAIRIEPYLIATGRVHPDLAGPLGQLAEATAGTHLALVHGDVSPKNILAGPAGPVFLDAECAWYGDPAFDLAFCLNHLLLKCLWTPRAADGFLACFDRLAETYLDLAGWEPRDDIERRAARLLPGLLLARIDGKSPVEYVTAESDKNRARRVARTPAARSRRPAVRGARGVGGGKRAIVSDTSIARVYGRRVWDSRGRPTVEAEVHLAGGAAGRAIAPAGASTGSGEAIELRAGGARLGGRDVQNALLGITSEIAGALTGVDAVDQAAVDRVLIELDGTPQKSRLGGNALVAVSMAALHAAAAAAGKPLYAYLLGDTAEAVIPLPEIQIFGGGAHAGRRVDIQDFMIVAPAARSFDQAVEWTAEVYRAAGDIMAERGLLQGVADEGGYWPAFDTNEAALEALLRAIERAGFAPGQEIAISLDIAASEFHQDGRYRLACDGRTLDSNAMAEMLIGWLDRYPIVSIEDPLAEDDPDGLRRFTAAVGHRVQIVGDDFLVTSAARVRQAAASGACNAVLVKPNQAGTVSEAKAALDAAREAGWGAIVSARSGETEDTTIVHLAVGWGALQLKVGSFARSERMAKWNETLRIEEALGERANFAGAGPLRVKE
jgi:enolase